MKIRPWYLPSLNHLRLPLPLRTAQFLTLAYQVLLSGASFGSVLQGVWVRGRVVQVP